MPWKQRQGVNYFERRSSQIGDFHYIRDLLGYLNGTTKEMYTRAYKETKLLVLEKVHLDVVADDIPE